MGMLEKIYFRYYLKAERWMLCHYQTWYGFLITTLFLYLLSIFFIEKIFYPAIIKPYVPIIVNIYNFGTVVRLLYHAELYLIIVFIVFQKVKYPIIRKNKVGIFLAIKNIYGERRSKLFINKIKLEVEHVLDNSDIDDDFKVVLLDEHKSRKVEKGKISFLDSTQNKSKWGINLKKSRWHFILYGVLRAGGIQGGEACYKIEPNYAVRHAIIPKAISRSMSKDFTDFLRGQEWHFPISEDMVALDIISSNIRENILFAVGAAAFVSGAIKPSIVFHEELLDLIRCRLVREQHLLSVEHKLKIVLPESYRLMQMFYLNKVGDIDLAIDYGKKAIALKPNFYDIHINLAACYYEKDRELYIRKIRKHVAAAKKYSANSTFKLSEVFILIDFEKKYKPGVDLYIETLRRGAIPENIIDGTIIFLKRQKSKRPEDYLDFLIGLIHYFKKKKDFGKKMFVIFLDSNKNNKELGYMLKKAKTYRDN